MTLLEVPFLGEQFKILNGIRNDPVIRNVHTDFIRSVPREVKVIEVKDDGDLRQGTNFVYLVLKYKGTSLSSERVAWLFLSESDQSFGTVNFVVIVLSL